MFISDVQTPGILSALYIIYYILWGERCYRSGDGNAFLLVLFFFKILFIYLCMRDTGREAETQAEGEAGSMLGARRGTRSWVSRITLRAAGSAKPLSHPSAPKL